MKSSRKRPNSPPEPASPLPSSTPSPFAVGGPGPARGYLTAAVIERAARLIARGESLDAAAQLGAGVNLSSFKQWARRGRKELVRCERGGEPKPDEALYATLASALDQALAASEIRDNALIDRVAQGGLPMAVATESERRVPVTRPDGSILRDEQGVPVTLIERTRTTQRSETLPVWTAAAWRLERRSPEFYGRRTPTQHFVRDEDDRPPVPRIMLQLPANDRNGGGPDAA